MLGMTACAGNQPERPTPADQQLFLSLVRGLQEGGRHNAALAYLNDYRRSFPGDPEGVLLTAEALLGLGRVTEAAELFSSLTGTAEIAGRSFWGLGRCYAAVGRWEEAIGFLESASYANPSDARFLNDLGFAHIMVGRSDLAFHYLAQAADLAPGDELIIANFLLAAQRSGRGELVRDATSRMGDPDKREKMEKFLLEWRPNAVRNHSETSTVVND